MDPTISQRNAALTTMEKGRGYEAFYSRSERKEITEYHCHDFYEFYMHVHGGQYFGLDNSLYLLKPYQIFIIPPFSMHGLSSVTERNDPVLIFLQLLNHHFLLLLSHSANVDKIYIMICEK